MARLLEDNFILLKKKFVAAIIGQKNSQRSKPCVIIGAFEFITKKVKKKHGLICHQKCAKDQN